MKVSQGLNEWTLMCMSNKNNSFGQRFDIVFLFLFRTEEQYMDDYMRCNEELVVRGHTNSD